MSAQSKPRNLREQLLGVLDTALNADTKLLQEQNALLRQALERESLQRSQAESIATRLSSEVAELARDEEKWRLAVLALQAKRDGLEKDAGRRATHDRDEAVYAAVSTFALGLLPVGDSLHRALEAMKQTGDKQPAKKRKTAQSKHGAAIVSGIEATEKLFLDSLQKMGIARMDIDQGAPLDPNMHCAVAQVETPDQNPGTIVTVFQAGYTMKLGDKTRLLRNALVTVATKPANG